MVLLLMVGVFVVLLALVLLALRVPAAAAERKARSARLGDVQRFRQKIGEPEVIAPGKRAAETTAVGQQALRVFDRAIRARGSRGDITADLEGAGVRIRPEEWAAIQLSVIIIAAALFYFLVRSIFGVPVGAVVGWFACRAYLRMRRSRREAAFLEQIPETLQLISGSLKAGFSLGQSLGTVVREGTEPTAGEFNRALTEARLGANLEDALDGVAQRMRCQDLAWVVIAIKVSREVGGNLSEVIGTTVTTMRQRAELRGLVKSLSAEGVTSAKILTAMPFVVAAAVMVMNPTYLTPLFHTTTGYILMAAGAGLLSTGVFWLSRLVKIEV
ncbi:type II secretion system F family protein [Nocardioides baekrokdamisoli]|nr:type II secretion system F family protein [Nocardioides baekrokdamisoli]